MTIVDNILQYFAICCNILQFSAMSCNLLQKVQKSGHPEVPGSGPPPAPEPPPAAISGNPLQSPAIPRNLAQSPAIPGNPRAGRIYNLRIYNPPAGDPSKLALPAPPAPTSELSRPAAARSAAKLQSGAVPLTLVPHCFLARHAIPGGRSRHISSAAGGGEGLLYIPEIQS